MIEQAQQLSWAIAVRSSLDFFNARQQARLLLQGSRAIGDPAVVNYVNKIFTSDLLHNGLKNNKSLLEFKNAMHQWIKDHRLNSIIGLDSYQIDFSAGTTQSFDSFYYRHRNRRMRCFVGEYFYHLKAWISNGVNWSFISESDPLSTNDALVISLPFCDTGNDVLNLNQLLSQCDKLGIPVLIDCCYYAISAGVNADLSSSCIDTIAFSLSKAFPIANLRIGLRYTRDTINDGQRLHDSINYNNSLSAYIGLQLINKFSADYIYNTYVERQRRVCDYFNLSPSKSVIFALGDHSWSIYNRSNLLNTYQLNLDPTQFKNRICLVGIFDNWDIFNEIAS